MEITKELKEKLLKANSEDEVKTLLGDRIPEEAMAELWKKMQKMRPANGLESVDDDELAAVNGGFDIFYIFTKPFADPDRDFEEKGCAATVEYGSWCGSNDLCGTYEVTYTNTENMCVYGSKGHDWGEPKLTYEQNKPYFISSCKKCGKERRV